MMDNNKMDNEIKQTLLNTSKERHNEYVNNQQKQVNKGKQYDKLIKKVDNGASVNADTIKKLGNEINLFVDDNTINTQSKNIGCFKTKYNMTYKSDLKTFDHPNVVGTLGPNLTYDDCKRAAEIANKPYFAIGPGFTDDVPNSKICIIGEGSEVFDFDTGKEPVQVVEYDNLLASNKHFVSNGGNPNGYLRIEDGTINFYSTTNNYFTSYDNIFNYNTISNTSYYKNNHANLKDYLIATNDPYYLKNPDIRINYLGQELINNNDNDVNSFQKINQTICNRLTGTGKDCVGYTHIRNKDGSNFLYFFNELNNDLKITNANNRSSNSNYILADTYTKIKYPDLYLTIKDDGSLIFFRKKSNNIPEKTYTLIPPDTDTANIIESKDFINNRKYGKNFLKNGESLYNDEFIASDNGKYRARVNKDGNLVIEKSTYGCYKDQQGNEVGSNTFNLTTSTEPNINIYSVNGRDYNINENTKLIGGEEIEYINTNNQGSCLKKCNANPECSSFSYINDQQKCIFYKNSQNTPSEYDKNYSGKLYEKTKDNNNVDKTSNIGKLGYIDNTGNLLEYAPEDISFKDEYYKPILDIVYKVKGTRQNYYSNKNTSSTNNNRNDSYFSSGSPEKDILITNPETLGKPDKLGQLPEYVAPYFQGDSDLTQKCKDKCNSIENCSGYSVGTIGENTTTQQCLLYNKEVYQKGEKTAIKNMKTHMKKVYPKNNISLTNQVVKSDETTWNNFPLEDTTMNDSIKHPSVEKQNTYNETVGSILAGNKNVEDTENTEDSEEIEGYSNVKEGLDVGEYHKLYEDRFKIYNKMKDTRTPLKSGIRKQETSIFGFQNIIEGMKSPNVIREYEQQAQRYGNNKYTIQGVLTNGNKDIEYATNNLIHWGILGVITLIIGNDLLNYSKS